MRVPQPVAPYMGTVNASAFGNQCIQQSFSNLTFPSDVPAPVGQYLAAFVAPALVPQSEDCMYLFSLPKLKFIGELGIGLNLNVIVPANATKDSKLPVAVVSVGISYPALEACSFSYSGSTEERSSLGPTPCKAPHANLSSLRLVDSCSLDNLGMSSSLVPSRLVILSSTWQ